MRHFQAALAIVALGFAVQASPVLAKKGDKDVEKYVSSDVGKLFKHGSESHRFGSPETNGGDRGRKHGNEKGRRCDHPEKGHGLGPKGCPVSP